MTDIKQAQAALEAVERLHETLCLIRSMMDEPDEIVTLNIPSFRADIDCMIKDLMIHGPDISKALKAHIEREQGWCNGQPLWCGYLDQTFYFIGKSLNDEFTSIVANENGDIKEIENHYLKPTPTEQE